MMLPQIKILVAQQAVDFRKGIDSLCGVVREELGADPMETSLFVFHNRSRDQLKILWYDTNGYVLWLKRLSQGRFNLSQYQGEISASSLVLLMKGTNVLSSNNKKQ